MSLRIFHSSDIFPSRIEEVVHESMQKELEKSVGTRELALWKN